MFDPHLFVLASAITLVGAVLQSSVGFGYGLVVVPALLLLDSRLVPAPSIFASLFLMAWVAYRNRFALTDHRITPLLAGLVIGAPLGALLLAHIGQDILVYCVAAMVAIGLVVSFARLTIRVTPGNQFLAGMASNVFGTVTGIGGVPVALLYQNETGGRIRAVLSTTFFIGGLISITALAVTKQFTLQSAILALHLLPGIILGNLLGRRYAPIIDRGYSKMAILGLSLASLIYLLGSVLFSG